MKRHFRYPGILLMSFFLLACGGGGGGGSNSSGGNEIGNEALPQTEKTAEGWVAAILDYYDAQQPKANTAIAIDNIGIIHLFYSTTIGMNTVVQHSTIASGRRTSSPMDVIEGGSG
ncbi:MAG: hypothetical protein C4526_04135, partial [Nitrospiraceae bacterium]